MGSLGFVLGQNAPGLVTQVGKRNLNSGMRQFHRYDQGEMGKLKLILRNYFPRIFLVNQKDQPTILFTYF